jgi:protein gp37
MGMYLEQTTEMGEYSVEVRRESFYLRGEHAPEHRSRHAIEVYPEPGNPTQGGIAFHHKQWGGLRPKINGCEIDGREWKDFPAALAA